MRGGDMPGQAAGLPRIGQTLGGKYEIVGLLGEGGMASVFEANHRRLHQRVAIKVLAPELGRDPELVARFEREARAVAGLRTRHVVRVMDVDATAEGIAYMVMEFLEGRDLDAELRARSRLPCDEAVDYLLQACAAMVEAHGMGIIHRDLKPANLFLATEREGEDRVVKVLDFGISKMAGEATRLTGVGAVMGTVLYMSPEQVRAQPTIDTRADIWALGVILYELVTGRAPWEGHSQQIAADIVSRDPPDLRTFAPAPEGVAEAVRTMLQREPSRRFATVHDVLAALAPFAPPGSVGAAVAEQVLAQSAARRPSMIAPSMKQTMPMLSRPYPPAALTPAPAEPTAPGPASLVPISVGARARARLVLVFAVVIGLVGVAGVVLILLATRQRSHAPKPASTATATATAAPVAASTTEDASSAKAEVAPPASVSAEPVIPAPPATGTGAAGNPSSRVGAPASAAAPASGKKPATGLKPRAPAPPPSGAPAFL